MEILQNWFNEHSDMFITYATSVVIALIIYIVGAQIAKVLSKLCGNLMEKRKLDPVIVSFVSNIIHGLLMVIVIIAALSQLGIQTTSFIAVIGAAGLAIGLALQGSLSNFASGVLIIAFRPFKAGDFIEAGGQAGIVESIQLFSTIIRSGDNKEITLANSSVVGSAIVNYSAKPTRRIDLVIGVSYDADIRHAKRVLTEVVAANELVLKDPEAVIAVHELADSSVNFVVRPWVKTADYWTVYFELMENIKIRLDDENIGIPYPQMDLHIQKTNIGEEK